MWALIFFGAVGTIVFFVVRGWFRDGQAISKYEEEKAEFLRAGGLNPDYLFESQLARSTITNTERKKCPLTLAIYRGPRLIRIIFSAERILFSHEIQFDEVVDVQENRYNVTADLIGHCVNIITSNPEMPSISIAVDSSSLYSNLRSAIGR